METIPKIIHQLWIGHHNVPYKFIDTWKDYIDKNPSWQYKLWREEDIDGIDMQNREIYDEEYGYCGKADIARYEILYQHGGIWIDADAVWLGDKSLDPLIEGAKKTNFFAAHEPSKSFPVMSPSTANNKSAYAAWKRSLLAIGVIGASKEHPNLKFLLDELSKLKGGYTELRKKQQITHTTGPVFFTKTIKNNFLSATMYPTKYFYPVTWKGITDTDYHKKNKMPEESYMFQYGITTNALWDKY